MSKRKSALLIECSHNICLSFKWLKLSHIYVYVCVLLQKWRMTHRFQHLPADASAVTKPDTEEEDPTWMCQETHWARPFSVEGQRLVNKWINKYHVRTSEKHCFLHSLKKLWMVLAHAKLAGGRKDAAMHLHLGGYGLCILNLADYNNSTCFIVCHLKVWGQ